MIRSSNSLLYGFISLIPYGVRSTKDGRTYRELGVIMKPSPPTGPRWHCAPRDPAVPIRILLDLLDALAGVLRGSLGQNPLDVEDLLGLDLDVRRSAADAAVRLVQHDLRVRHG